MRLSILLAGLLWSTTVLFSTSSAFSEDAQIDDATILKKYSVEELWDMSTLLTAAADEAPQSKAHCGLESKKAFALEGPLQALIDEKKKDFVDSHKKKKGPVAALNWGPSCKTSCRCGLYSSIYENLGYENLARNDQVLSKQVTASAMNQDRKNEADCASNLHALCDSLLMKYLNQNVAVPE